MQRGCATVVSMLVEARAAGYVYHAPNDRLEVRASPDARGGQATLATAALLLSAAGKLVGVDLRETPAGCVLMLGAHEDVSSQVKAPVHVAVDGDGKKHSKRRPPFSGLFAQRFGDIEGAGHQIQIG